MKILSATAAALIMVFTGQIALATTINPDAFESATPGGDYSDAKGTGPNITSSQPILVGQTTLNGGLRLRCVGGDCSDTSGLRDPSDAFFLTVGADRKLTSLVLNLTSGNSPALSLDDISFEVEVNDPSSPPASSLVFSGEKNNESLIPGITGSAEFGPGTYGFFIGATGSSADFSGRVDWSLTATVIDTTVSSVPVPASLPLLLAGVFGLRFASRKARQRPKTA